jgi:hypothetical protein
VPRFVLLRHDWPELHFDLFLEAGGELQSWKLPADFTPSQPSPVIPGEPHRSLYLEYEGAVSGGRGTVTRWDHGEFEWIAERRAHFSGARLTGLYEWAETADDGTWTFRSVT